ncbi:MAG: hypothetical protein J6386_17670 [Candidatus Synoicihabitans palmerolidicus]|nr:hypothetical protein [Candidatus Synoicihabitans palmerolidicus]
MRFPFSDDWLPDASAPEARKRPYRSDRRRYRHHGQVQLPAGYAPTILPSPFTAESEIATFRVSLALDDNTVRYDLSQEALKTILRPDDYAVYQRSVRSLQHWLEQSVALRRDNSTSATIADRSPNESAAALLEDFPILSTGEGQLALLESLYPEGHDDVRRRAALQRPSVVPRPSGYGIHRLTLPAPTRSR